MKISKLMTRNVRTLEPERSIREAATLMADIDSGALLINEGDRLIGMITDRDIAVRGVADGKGPDCSVRDLMSSDVICARDTDDVLAVAQRMSDAQVRRLPVVDADDRIVGMVSLGDLSREAQQSAATTALEGVSQPGGQHQQ